MRILFVLLSAFPIAAQAAVVESKIAVAPAGIVPKQDPKASKKLDEAAWEHFGDGITQGAAVPLADVLKAPDSFTGKTVRIEGPITAVCQTKGCWMYLGENAKGSPFMVKFKDYAFFVPKDASGRTTIIEGTLTLKQETVEETKHYLEDAGKSEEAAKVTEGRKLWRFMASGVAIKKAVLAK